ncbi:TonB-dependent receptor [Fulvivirga kasyanovii]|uniref:TonB-dependent receptor n=2 Tax=Fulvivirga kasyanovii TaxID=396812 RepID=UPI0031E0BE12
MKHLYLSISILLLVILSAKAQENEDSVIYELKPITVSEAYMADDSAPIPYQNLNMNALEVRNTGQEPSFLLSETPSMTVYSDAGSYQGYSYIRLRGIDQTRINMTLDGVPLNEPEDQGVYFSNYPDFLNSVSKVQIQRGVGTTKNGIASFAGSLQFNSPRLFDDSSSTSFGLGYGSFQSYRAYAEHKSRKRNKSLYLRGSWLNSDGYKHRSANSSKSVFYGAGIYNKKNKFKLIGFAGNQQNELAWLGVSQSKIDEDPRANANTQENDEFTQSLTQLQHEYLLNDRMTISSSIYYNYLEGNYDFDLNNYLGMPSTSEMLNYAFQSHFIGGFSNVNFKTNKVEWTAGIHLNTYSREHIGSDNTAGRLYKNTGYKPEQSAFAKMSYALWDELTLFADIQYRHTSFDYEGSVPFDKMDWSFVNPKGGVTYRPQENMDIYFSVGKTGREPTRNDLFGGWDDLQADDSGAPLLSISDPEYVVDYELGIRINRKDASLAINLYHMDFDNEIVLNGQFGPNGLVLNSNVDKSTRQGIEANFVCNAVRTLTFETNLSLNRSEIEQQSENFDPILTPAVIINQDVSYTRKHFETGIGLRYQSSSYIDFANENEIDDYLLVNWRASYKFKRVTLSAFINNVTDIIYYNNGYVDFDGTNKYFVQAPRNYYGMITYSF